jgi:hypothetical protein
VVDVSNSGSAQAQAWHPATLQKLLSTDRLQSYLNVCGNDLAQALELYAWNLKASAAIIELAAMVEVVTRNALDAQLAVMPQRRGDWIDAIQLDNQGATVLAKAVDRATKGGRVSRVHGKVIAELNLGFWRYLTAQRYHASLWVPFLHKAFPGGSTDLRRRRQDVEHRLDNLTVVRNRAAHHEPIHKRNLGRDLQNSFELLTWVNPEAAAWAMDVSTLAEVIAAKPPVQLP